MLPLINGKANGPAVNPGVLWLSSGDGEWGGVHVGKLQDRAGVAAGLQSPGWGCG